MPKKIKIWVHIIFWIFWITALFWAIDLKYFDINNALTYFTHFFLSWLCHAVFFYFTYLYLIPKLLFRGKYVQFIFFYLTLAFFNVYAHSYFWNSMQWKYLFYIKPEHLWHLIGWQFVILFYSTSLRFWEEWINSEEGKLALKHEVKTSELDYLKSQMSPHFLFNTLNNIYSLSISGEEKTTEAINQLKNMMGYVHHFEKGEQVNLKTEAQYLKDFISLNQLRYPVPVIFDILITDYNKTIEPMLFLPFIENAFKHGDTSKNGYIYLTLIEDERGLKFEIRNKTIHQKRKDDVSGVGIKNVKQRVQLIYPFNNQFDVKVSNDEFRVKLELR